MPGVARAHGYGLTAFPGLPRAFPGRSPVASDLDLGSGPGPGPGLGPGPPSAPNRAHRSASPGAGHALDTAAGWAHSFRHMLESLKPRSGKRWPRGQKFVMSSSGTVAELAYREAVQAARAQGRPALAAAQESWAAPLHLDPADGVVLGELRAGRKS